MARARRGRGEGSVYQDKSGLYRAYVTIGYDETGKRRRKYLSGQTKRAVLDKLAQLKHDAVNGEVADAQRMTVGAYLDHWIATRRTSSKLADTTLVRYEELIRLHIKPYIGGQQLEKVTALNIQKLYERLATNGASPRTRELVHVTLNVAFKRAVRWKMLRHNPCVDVDRPASRAGKRNTFTAEQCRQFFAAARTSRLYALFVVAPCVMAREGELFALQWTDIDLQAGTMSITKNLQELRGKHKIKATKTEAGRRLLPLPQTALDALREHRRRMLLEGNIAGPVFCDRDGGYLRKSNFLRRDYRETLKAAELPYITFHDLRHTGASLLLGQGVHPKIASEMLGHASIQITLDTYSHVIPSLTAKAAIAVDAALNGCKLAANSENDADKG